MAELTLERDLATSLQLPRKELAQHRTEMQKGKDWDTTKSRAIGYTDIGVEKLHALLGLVNEVRVDGPTMFVAKVTWVKVLNPRLIKAEYKGSGILVRVMNKDLYVVGIAGVIRKDGPGWVEARRPRRKGYVQIDDL